VIITDAARVNAQAGRMDGQCWNHLAGNPKAWTLPGSWASWPIGITEARDFRAIALCEGGPDFLAAHYLALWNRLHISPSGTCNAFPWRCWGHPKGFTRTPCHYSPASVSAFSAMMMKRAGARWNAGRATGIRRGGRGRLQLRRPCANGRQAGEGFERFTFDGRGKFQPSRKDAAMNTPRIYKPGSAANPGGVETAPVPYDGPPWPHL